MANFLTSQDVADYGTDLVDFAQRAAVHALSPTLQQIQEDNAALRQRLAVEARRNMDAAVERAIPNFREVDRDPRWHRYLLEPHPLSGRPRQQWLNDAMASGDANRVIAFFREFMRGAGNQPASTHSERARTASSNRLPTYTPASIGELYSRHRRGEFAGREAEWNRIEADFFRAQREGRVQGMPYLTK